MQYLFRLQFCNNYVEELISDCFTLVVRMFEGLLKGILYACMFFCSSIQCNGGKLEEVEYFIDIDIEDLFYVEYTCNK